MAIEIVDLPIENGAFRINSTWIIGGLHENHLYHIYIIIYIYIYVVSYIYIYVLEAAHLSSNYQWINHVPLNCSQKTEPDHIWLFDDSVQYDHHIILAYRLEFL